MSNNNSIPEKLKIPALDIGSLSEEEREHIVNVVVKDFEVRAADRKRLSKFQEIISNNVMGSNIRLEVNNCTLCGREFNWLSRNRIICKSCNRPICERCSTPTPSNDKILICTLCIRKKGFKAMTCEWFYQTMVKRFEDFGSSIIVKQVLGDKYSELKAVSDYYLEPNRRSIALESDEKMINEYRNETLNLLEVYTNVIYASTEKHYIATKQDLDNIAENVVNYVREQIEKIIKEPIDKETLENFIHVEEYEDDKMSVIPNDKTMTPESYLTQILVDKVRVKLKIPTPKS